MVTDHAGVVTGDAEQCALNAENGPDYNRQMTAEHKVLVRKPGGRQDEMWMPIPSGAANHYFDCEVMQFALADMLRLDTLRPEPPQPNEPERPPPPMPRSRLMNRRPIRRHYG